MLFYFCIMQFSKIIEDHEIPVLRVNLIQFARNCRFACVLDSKSEVFGKLSYTGWNYDLVAGFADGVQTRTIDNFESLATVNTSNSDWLLGFLTYDLKNDIEALHSKNQDFMTWPSLFFFVPEILITLHEKKLVIDLRSDTENPEHLLKMLLNAPAVPVYPTQEINLVPRISKVEYLHTVRKIKDHIRKGDIYEINYCQEFFANNSIDPYNYFLQLSDYTPSPFSAFFKHHRNYLLSASPERFMKKHGSKLISQPIKGTAPRGITREEDRVMISKLLNSQKERSENIMIVDLVRNDLSRIALPKSVSVDELCRIYTFPQVHQMISTISASTAADSFREIMQATFPMGSMTGAPKIEAMKIVEELEKSKRGLYSGAVGYISPGMDFDFNVVIRSLQYQAEAHYLSYFVGSAITDLSDAELEYEECMLKAYAINPKLSTTGYA
jgi:para-aminobenzoate synthetase component 1